MSRESSEGRPVPQGSTRRRGQVAKPGRASKRFRPIVLALEGRALLATITVTSLADSGAGSLRQAILDSAAGGAINFDPTLDGGTISLTGGPLSITKELTIDGPGSGQLTIDGGGKSGDFVVGPATLSSTTPPVNVTIDGLTIANGMAAYGGGINSTQANLTLDDDVLLDNTASQGGGALVAESGFYGSSGPQPPNIVAGSLSATGTTFQGNQSSGSGGAILDYDTPTTFAGSTFVDNLSTVFGGAIYHQQLYNPQGTLAIGGSLFTGNTSNSPVFGLGGAIYNSGTATVAGSRFVNNMAIGPDVAQGGAIHNNFGAKLTVTGSSFLGNQAQSGGSFGFAAGGALSGDSGSSMDVEGSVFSGNAATAGNSAEGGAIKDVGGGNGVGTPAGLTVSGSSFVNNQAVGLSVSAGSPGNASGGALFNTSGILAISNSQFLGNQALAGSAGAKAYGGIADGGGVANLSAPLTLTGSTFLGNASKAGSGGLGGGFAIGGGFSDEFLPGPTASSISGSRFIGNNAVGGAGTGASAAGGFVQGGGISLSDNAPVNLTDVTVVGNSAVGGNGGPAGSTAGSQGGAGGPATGGGLGALSTSATVTDGRIIANLAKGGGSPAGVAGDAQGGGLYSGGSPSTTLALNQVLLLGNQAQGGDGLSGGNGEGGGLWVAGIVQITNSDVIGNQSDGGAAGEGLGGGIYLAKTAKSTIDAKSVIVGNAASTSGNDLYQA